MKSKKNTRNQSKNSKPVAASKEKQPKMVINKDTQIVLTIKEQGRFSHRQSNAATKEQRNRLSYAPGKCPKTLKQGGEYLEPVYHECSRRMVLNPDAVQWAASKENVPYGVKTFDWNKMSVKSRVEANLAIIAEGKSFTYELLD